MKKRIEKAAQFINSIISKLAILLVVWIVILIVLWIIILRDEPKMLTGVTATATVTLAFAAFWAIWQNQNIYKRERKVRLLNEIIEWAENIINSGYSENIDHTKLGNIDNQQQEFAYINDLFSKLSANYEKMKVKSISIVEDATYFGEELLGDVTTLSDYLFNYSEIIDYILGTSDKEREYRYKLKYNNPEASEEIKRRMSNSGEILINQAEQMDMCAKKIIKQATNMKHNI